MHIGEIVVTAFIGFALIGAIGYFLTIYNGLIAMKNNIARSWANIDVLLKQRHDELPKLVKTCEAYMQHERAIFDKLSDARGAVMQAKTVGERGAAENMLTRALGQFFAVAEAYPDLKANQSFLSLQNRITEVENHIADRREFYNESVNINNVSIEQFPELLIARLFNFKPFELLQFAADELKDVDIGLRFSS
jgi:LemA protein